jgi:hypothetical protein
VNSTTEPHVHDLSRVVIKRIHLLKKRFRTLGNTISAIHTLSHITQKESKDEKSKKKVQSWLKKIEKEFGDELSPYFSDKPDFIATKSFASLKQFLVQNNDAVDSQASKFEKQASSKRRITLFLPSCN